MLIAMTREISPSLDRCELTHLQRVPIDLQRARMQHRRYEECLATLGCRLVRLPAGLEMPDGVFIEDTAVVLDELAIITQPGAVSRRAETAAVAEHLASHRELAWIRAPATIDGGDVLRMGRRLFIGLTARTNRAGIAQMEAILEPHGYRVQAVAVGGCLHLKSAVTRLAGDAVLINREWVDPQPFAGMRSVDVDPGEPQAANALPVADTVVFPEAYPRTRRRIEALGLEVRAVAASELAKAEGSLTCCSLIFEEFASSGA